MERSLHDEALVMASRLTNPAVWVLNLDAEHELAATRRYSPTRHLNALVARESKRLLGNLIAPGDLVLTEGQVARMDRASRDALRACGARGFAWSPTPRALSLLERAGAEPVLATPLDVLRQVNARPFASAIREPLAEGSFAKWIAGDLDSALAHLARPTPDGWLVRRHFGAAGRGRRRIASGRPDEAERAWLVAGLRQGPLVIEPWVRVTREYTRSGWVHTGGRVEVFAPCFQSTTDQGAWLGTEAGAPDELRDEDDRRLGDAAQEAGQALAAAGYTGPFGIDAFRHRVPGRPGGRDVLNPMSEINARFTMDWTTGFGSGRESAASVAARTFS